MLLNKSLPSLRNHFTNLARFLIKNPKVEIRDPKEARMLKSEALFHIPGEFPAQPYGQRGHSGGIFSDFAASDFGFRLAPLRQPL
jgi:hypothetical protein